MLIKTGRVEFHRSEDPTLDGASGPRHYLKQITFGGRYKKKPTVVTSVAGWDIYNSANSRVSVEVEGVDEYGCTIHLHTWADTKIWSLTVAWVAYGD